MFSKGIDADVQGCDSKKPHAPLVPLALYQSAEVALAAVVTVVTAARCGPHALRQDARACERRRASSSASDDALHTAHSGR